MRLALLGFIGCAFLALGGCTTAGSALSSVAVSFTSATPAQATTLAEANQAATIAEQAIDVYVKTGNPSRTVLTELKTLMLNMHAPLSAANLANASGQSASAAAGLAAFNEALAAFNSYATNAGVTH